MEERELQKVQHRSTSHSHLAGKKTTLPPIPRQSQKKTRCKPHYFPFTEPSVELQAYKEGYGWLEFGGSGIFRPELTLPLGIKVPVLAWGIGVDRLFMMRARLDDIRMLFAQDLDWMRKQKVA